MGAAVETGAAGEEAVAVADLAYVALGGAGSHERSCAAIFPKVDIVLSVEGNNAAAGGAAGGVDAHAFLKRLCQQTVGVSVAQVCLGDEGQLVQIGGGLDILGLYALGIHHVTVVRYVIINMLYLLYEALILQSLYFLH